MDTQRISSSSLNELVIDPKLRLQVLLGIERAIEDSFREDARRDERRVKVPRTEREEKRRISICLDLFERLRGDCGWSVDRIVDVMSTALRTELDGTVYEPRIETGLRPVR